MKTHLLLFCACATIPATMRAQASAIIPPHARAALAQADSASPTALSTRRRYLDSLAAGRVRWVTARVREYRLQTHIECYCSPETAPRPLPLLRVRGGTITTREPGVASNFPPASFTVEQLFAWVERDLRDSGRRVSRLVLDPRRGFPRQYDAETEGISDLGVQLRVDSFSVVRRVKAAHSKRSSNVREPVGRSKGSSLRSPLFDSPAGLLGRYAATNDYSEKKWRRALISVIPRRTCPS